MNSFYIKLLENDFIVLDDLANTDDDDDDIVLDDSEELRTNGATAMGLEEMVSNIVEGIIT